MLLHDMSFNRFNFGFHHLLGPVYGEKEGSSKGAELMFMGDSLLSPVGNRINVIDLRLNSTRTLTCENRSNIAHLVLSPNHRVLLSIDHTGNTLLIALPKGVEVGRYSFRGPVSAAAFSPDGRYVAVAVGRAVDVWVAPDVDRKQFNPFRKYRSFIGAFDDVTTIDWSHDSKHVVLGSRDMTCRVYSLKREVGFKRGILGGHKDFIVGAAFDSKDKTQIFTVSRDATLCCWKWSYDPALLELSDEHDVEDDDGDVPSSSSSSEGEDEEEDDEDDVESAEEAENVANLTFGKWHLVSKHFFNVSGGRHHLKSVAFHRDKGILVAGFSEGLFGVYSLGTMEVVHTFSVGTMSINSVAINSTGEWIGLGSGGHLLVWEWQSETYIIKQQAHAAGIRKINYSPDGRLLASAGQDGKIKLWDAATGACFVTFGDHHGPVTDVVFNPKGNAIFSSSMDGTIRGFDLTRYRNFRTIASPNPVQFSCIAMDPSGEIVCGGTMDEFTVYVFSVQTGVLLEVLTGHQAPVSCVLFSPTDPVLATCGWDGTVRLNELYGRGRGAGTREVLRHGETGRDVVCAAFRQDGLQLVAGLLDGSIHVWDPKDAIELGVIEGRNDIWAGRGALDMRKAGRQSSHFNALAYAPGGDAVMAVADGSRWVLMYGIASRTLLKRFSLSENVSIDGVLELQNTSKLTDFGPLAEVAPDPDELETRQKAVPGATAPKSRDIRVSPSGDEWCALSPEGIHVFRRDPDLVLDAPGLGVEDTPESVAVCLRSGDLTRALAVSLGLESSVVPKVLECIPTQHISLVASALPLGFVGRLLSILAEQINSDKPSLHLYLIWVRWLLSSHFRVLMNEYSRFREPVLAIQRAVLRKSRSLSEVCGANVDMLRFLELNPPPEETDGDLLLEEEPEGLTKKQRGEFY